MHQNVLGYYLRIPQKGFGDSGGPGMILLSQNASECLRILPQNTLEWLRGQRSPWNDTKLECLRMRQNTNLECNRILPKNALEYYVRMTQKTPSEYLRMALGIAKPPGMISLSQNALKYFRILQQNAWNTTLGCLRVLSRIPQNTTLLKCLRILLYHTLEWLLEQRTPWNDNINSGYSR